ncbi:MAG: hypothetical protein LBS54_00615 [Dysgonamonadaceae bacterium]|nr:hypothetical protein [Dysgonamonadaceae bacterium]
MQRQCMLAYNDNVCWHTTTMYAGMQRQCMLAYNDNVCWHATAMYAGIRRVFAYLPDFMYLCGENQII